jgi:hypothetical protein
MDWKAGFAERFGGSPREDFEDEAADLLVRLNDEVDRISHVTDQIAAKLAAMPESMTGIRIKEPCLPCARMAGKA